MPCKPWTFVSGRNGSTDECNVSNIMKHHESNKALTTTCRTKVNHSSKARFRFLYFVKIAEHSINIERALHAPLSLPLGCGLKVPAHYSRLINLVNKPGC